MSPNQHIAILLCDRKLLAEVQLGLGFLKQKNIAFEVIIGHPDYDEMTMHAYVSEAMENDCQAFLVIGDRISPNAARIATLSNQTVLHFSPCSVAHGASHQWLNQNTQHFALNDAPRNIPEALELLSENLSSCKLNLVHSALTASASIN